MWFKRNRPTRLKRGTTSKYQHLDVSTIELASPQTVDRDVSSKSDRSPWKHAFWRLGPLFGLAALFGSICCIGATLIVLVRSNNEEIADWSLQPSVYLSVSTNVGNGLLRFALGQALPVAWWCHALRGGTAMELHNEWAVGNSLYQALTNYRALGVTALGGIACALLGFVGPLLQRASTVVEAVPLDPISLQLRIAPELPTGWAGMQNQVSSTYAASDALNMAFGGYLQSSPIFTNVTGCQGTCTAKVSAPGLATNPERCTSFTVDLNGYDNLDQWPQIDPGNYLLYYIDLISHDPYNSTWFGPSTPSNIVPSNPAPRDPDRESVAIIVAYSDLENYKGSMTFLQCWFVSGILEYTVLIDNNGTTISLYGDQRDLPVVAFANNTMPLNADQTANATLANIFESSSILFDSTYALTADFAYETQNLTAFALKQLNRNDPNNAALSNFSDPLPAVLSNLNEVLFRGGVAAASDEQADYTVPLIDLGLNLTQTVTGQRIDKVSRFHSDIRFWAGASAFQVIAVVFNVMIFWGWWRIGRDVSFSPLEIAKAFDAPLLRDAYSNGDVKEIVKTVGGTRLRYGVKQNGLEGVIDSVSSERDPPAQQLVFGKYKEIRPPKKGQQCTM